MSIPRCPGCGATYGGGLVDENGAEWCTRCNYNWSYKSGFINRGGDPVAIAEYDRKKNEAASSTK